MLLVVRHGETDWNAEGRLQGHTDVPLNARGRAQAAELAASLRGAGVRWVLTSDLARAAETGAIVRAALALDAGEADVDPDLREQRFGVYEGLTGPECERKFGESWRWWKAAGGAKRLPPEGGESWEALVERVVAGAHRALDRAEREGGPGLLVTHGGVMRALLHVTTGERPSAIANCEVRCLVRVGGRLAFSAEDE